MDIYQSITEFLAINHSATLKSLAENAKTSKEYIHAVLDLDGSKNYKMNNGIITLQGLGKTRCIVCGQKTEYSSPISLRIPDEFLSGKVLDPTLSEHKIIGHKNCYNTIDVFFRTPHALHCIDCNHFHGEWVANDQVNEKCYKLGFEEIGHKGCIAANSMCNHFSPDTEMKDLDKKQFDPERKIWNDVKASIETRTVQGYKNLVTLLEKSYLLTEVKKK